MDKPQYAILRFAKYKGPEIGRIEAHDERTKEKYASNPDVDTSRSMLNFHLVKPHRSYRAEAEKQIAEAACQKGQRPGGGNPDHRQPGVLSGKEAPGGKGVF